MAQLNTIIILRNDSSTAWESSSYALEKGEVGIEFLENGKVKMKVGVDGKKTWSELPYFGGEESKVFEVSTIEELEAKEATTGDIGIVTEIVGEHKYQTAYAYNGSAWAAMDGNYSASNVFLKDKIVLAGDYGMDSRKDKITSIGNLRIGDEIAAGTSLQTVLMDMLSQRLQPSSTPTAPAASITLYTDGATKKTTAGVVEVGTTINPSYTASLSAGSYTYGPATRVVASSYSISSTGRKTVDGATAETVEDSATTSTGSFDSFVVDDDTSYKLNVSIPHNAGVKAHDNLGSEANPVVQIAAGTKTATSGTVSGYRAWFCGYKNGTNALDDATTITGAQVRALGNKANGSWKSSMDVSQMKQMFFAAPAGKGYKPVIKDSSTKAPQTVEGPITVAVEGANGFDAIDYDVWYVANASAASGSATLNITKS